MPDDPEIAIALKYDKEKDNAPRVIAKGMRFNAVNKQTGDFLGIVTIDAVEPNEAIGRIQGPKVGDVREGTEVKTQL